MVNGKPLFLALGLLAIAGCEQSSSTAPETPTAQNGNSASAPKIGVVGLDPDQAVQYFGSICVSNDPRTPASSKAARALGFKETNNAGELYNPSLNATILLFSRTYPAGKMAICRLIFERTSASLIAYERSLGNVPNLQESERESGEYYLNGNGQKHAIFANVRPADGGRDSGFQMIYGASADRYDKCSAELTCGKGPPT